MNYVEKQYNIQATRNKLSKKQFCTSYDKNLRVKIPSGFVSADVFFYNTNNNVLDYPFYKYPKFLANSINIDYSMLDKGMLYSNILKYNSGKNARNNSRKPLNLNNFIEIFPLSSRNKFYFPGNYILRPIYAFGGRDIIYVHNSEDFNKAVKYYETHRDYRNQIYSDKEITVAKIITDLLLFKRRKFHLRMYYIVAIIEGEISCFLLDTGKIITAKDPYNLDLPFSKDVHDTHLSSTDADYFFPNDITLDNIKPNHDETNDIRKDMKIQEIRDTILKGVRNIARVLSNIVIGLANEKPKSMLFENQQNGYYVYGLDILVRDNLEPVLIECNNQTGFSFHTIEKKKELSEIVYGWINKIILEPLFKHPGKATYYARKHKTYISP